MDEYYVIPEEVTAIADGAFAGNKSLKHIDLRNVRQIGAFAFQDCTNLESVIMRSVSVIGSGAFEFCRSLQDVSFGNIEEIGDLAFFHCGKLDIPEIPQSLTKAGAGAFSHTGLKHADLHWFEEIPANIFSYCTSMGYADVSGARVIHDDAFAGCRELSYVKFGELEKIGARAFQKCSSLEIAVLPDTLQSMGDEAFEKIRPRLVIPKSVCHIGGNCLGPVDIRKSVSIYKSGLYEFRNYFLGDRIVPEKEDEHEHFYMYESSIDVRVQDDGTDKTVGFIPLFCDMDPDMRRNLIDAFREDNTFNYDLFDTVLFSAMSWNQRCRDKVAVVRLKYPFELSDTARKEYSDYLRTHADRIARRAVWERNTDVLSYLCENSLISSGGIMKLLDYSMSLAASECTAILLEYRSKLDWQSDSLLEEL
ncbi:MAG: leucine-rich repeat protein [Mogibacterium sp.]|nr:leucine-rich repeat protein [Mogibacterium sp.]